MARAGSQIRKVDELRRKEVGWRLAPQAVDADSAGPHDAVIINRSTERLTQFASDSILVLAI